MSYTSIESSEILPGAVLDSMLLDKIKNNFDSLKEHNDFDDDIIKAPLATLVSGATTQFNGKVVFATDAKKMYYVVDGALVEMSHEDSTYYSTDKRSTADHSRKLDILNSFIRTAGSSTLQLNNAGNSATGIGRFEVIGTGTYKSKKYLPINPSLGIAESISIASSVAGATMSVGVEYFDSNLVSLGVRDLVLSAVAVPTTAIELNFYKALSQGIGTTADTIPQGARFAKSVVTVSANPGILQFDALDLINLTFAKAALFS